MTTDTDLVSESLPAYEIGGELGRGGWGVVLSGKHRALGRPVAIKQLPPSFASDPNVRRRFTTEGRLLASLDHPHVVPVYDFVEHDGLCLLVMELLPGGTVWSTFTRVGFNAHSAVAVALACAAGLKAAHDRGILHRDVKPENLMFAASGAVKVTDFGIAKVVGGDETLATRAGDVLGTPSYIAPEQARGRELSPATDVYALSTMLYELLAGALPFPEAGDAMAQLFQHAFDAPTQLLDVAPTVPDPIAEVVMRGLATDPADRYPTAEDFGIALAGASTGRWGPGWLAAEGIPVMGADTIVTAAGIGIAPSPTLTEGEHPSLPVTRPLTKSSAHESDPFATPPPTTEPTATQRPPRVESGEPRATEPSSPIVRPSITVHTAGVRLADVSDTDLVPVRTVVEIPPARVPLLIAAGLAVAAVGAALLSLGAPLDGQTPPPGMVSISGIDPAVAEPVVDLTEPLTVAITGPVPADTASMTLGVLDREVKTQSAPLLPAPGGAVATLPPLGGGYVAAGEFTGELTLSQAGQVTDTWRFPVDTKQPATTTAVAAGVAAVFLFSIAYLESFLRSLRRGRRRISGTVGVPVSAAVLAVSVVGAVWVLLGRQPTATTLVVTVSLAAAAGLAAAIGASRVGRRRRYRRAARRIGR